MEVEEDNDFKIPGYYFLKTYAVSHKEKREQH